MQKLIKTLSFTALAIMVATSCVSESEGNILKAGDLVPSFTVDGPDGTFSSGNYTGKGGLLVLFASYCPTCQEVMPEIEKLWKASSGGELFAVAPLSRQQVYSEDEGSVAEYWKTSRYTMPYYLDIKGEVYYRFAKETIPRIYVVDKERKITFMSVGNGRIKAEQLASELEKALGIEIDL